MLTNYLKTAYRSLIRNWGTSFINLLGLSVGLASALLIFMFVSHERSYDRFHADADRIYRVTLQEINRPNARHLPSTAPTLAPAMAEAYPEVESAVRLRHGIRHVVAYEDRRFYEDQLFYADSGFFDVFSLSLAQGDAATALQGAGRVVLTAETAHKYFGDADPIGAVLVLDHEQALTVTGVLEPLPSNTHLRFDLLVSFSTFRVPTGYPVNLESWGWVSFYTYVKLRPGADPAAMEARLRGLLRDNMTPEIAENRILHLEPLAEVYLSPVRDATMDYGNRGYVYGLAGIAVFILLVACFNFMNLTAARSTRRAREVGVRKALGASRGRLARQFLGEAVLVALLGLAGALVLVGVVAWAGGDLFGAGMATLADYGRLVPGFAVVAVLLGLVAGSYPAVVLSGFTPGAVLKGAQTVRTSAMVRKALVVFQFVLAVTLVACSLIVARQTRYLQERDLGIDEASVVVLHMQRDALLDHYGALRTRLTQNPHVAQVSMGGGLFDGAGGSQPLTTEGLDGDDAPPANSYGVHFGFVETMGIELVAGRAFDETRTTDSTSALMLNETATRVLGWTPEEAIGRHVQIGELRAGSVIGVMRDFHYAPLHTAVGPMVFLIPSLPLSHVFVRLRPGQVTDMMAALERDWRAVAPDYPFDYVFLDAHLQQLYTADRRFARLVAAFSALTIFVACLGLFGLVTFVMQIRIKEVGVRKVLGASVPGLVALLARPFLTYILIGAVLGGPLAYLVMQRWLAGFAYSISLQPGTFLLAGAVVFGLGMVTVAYHTVHAARANPVDSLRYE